MLWRVIGPAALGLLIVREFLAYLRTRDTHTTDGQHRTEMLQRLLQQVSSIEARVEGLDTRVEGQEDMLRHILTMVERVPQLDGRLIALERQLTKRG